MGFPAKKPSDRAVIAAGHLRDASVDLPPGEIVNPNSTAKLCEEVQLELAANAPTARRSVWLLCSPPAWALVLPSASPLYNMVPAPGTPSTFGFDAGLGIYTHIKGSLRSDGDYGLTGTSTDILARSANPILGVQLQFWGDPSNSGHDSQRGACFGGKKLLPRRRRKQSGLAERAGAVPGPAGSDPRSRRLLGGNRQLQKRQLCKR